MFSLYLQFQKLFVDGQLNNCDVRKYEEVTGFRLDFCDALPIDGLVPDDTVCDFTAGLMTKTTQYCYKGFWFTAQAHRKINDTQLEHVKCFVYSVTNIIY